MATFDYDAGPSGVGWLTIPVTEDSEDILEFAFIVFFQLKRIHTGEFFAPGLGGLPQCRDWRTAAYTAFEVSVRDVRARRSKTRLRMRLKITLRAFLLT